MDQDEDPKSIGVLSQELIASSNGCTNLPAELAPATDPIVAVERAKVMFGCYRKSDAADPETYAAAIAAVLAAYPLEIVLRVTNPVHGLPSKSNWLPTVKEVRDACDEIERREIRSFERQERERKQIEARKLDKDRSNRPTYDELKAKYGENWGLSAERSRAAAKARRVELQRHANRIMFERECVAAEMSPNSPISPSLASLIKAGMA